MGSAGDSETHGVIASFALTATPGKTGELVKAVLLRNEYNIPMSETAGVLLIERLGDLFAIILIGLGALVLFTDLGTYIAVSMGLFWPLC